MNSLYIVRAAIEQSLLFLPLALGIFLSYRILRITDLTVDGSFVLGAAVFAKTASMSHEPTLLLILAVSLFLGMSAGVLTALIAKRVPALLASILTLFILQSLNLLVMGKPNIALGAGRVLSTSPLSLVAMNACIITALYLLLKSRFGLMLRAYGDNPALLKHQGASLVIIRAAGLGLSNALVAFSGILNACSSGFADIQMGQGVVLIGIGTIVLGLQVFSGILPSSYFSIPLEIFAALTGVFLYFLTLHLLLFLGVPFLFLKMLVGGLLIFVMIYSKSKEGNALCTI